MSYQEEENTQTSTYNEAGFSISRLHNYWVKCEYFAQRNLLVKWKFLLDSIWRELYHDVERSPNKEALKKENEKLMKRIAFSKSKTQLYFNIQKRHEFLKKVQDSAGKGGSYRDESDEAFE